MTEGISPASLLRPVRAGNAFEETMERLLTAIRLGAVAPGERFPPEREFATQLGISRITLREALRALQQAGYVESRRGRLGGTFVTAAPAEPSRPEARRIARQQSGSLDDVLTFRMAVETGAAAALADRVAASPAGLPEVSRLVHDTLTVRLGEVNQADPADYRRLDTRFHLTIAELTGSTLLTTAVADSRLPLNAFLNAIPILRHNIEHTAVQHTAIVTAILSGDPTAARRTVAEHLEGTASLLRGFLT